MTTSSMPNGTLNIPQYSDRSMARGVSIYGISIRTWRCVVTGRFVEDLLMAIGTLRIRSSLTASLEPTRVGPIHDVIAQSGTWRSRRTTVCVQRSRASGVSAGRRVVRLAKNSSRAQRVICTLAVIIISPVDMMIQCILFVDGTNVGLRMQGCTRQQSATLIPSSSSCPHMRKETLCFRC